MGDHESQMIEVRTDPELLDPPPRDPMLTLRWAWIAMVLAAVLVGCMAAINLS